MTTNATYAPSRSYQNRVRRKAERRGPYRLVRINRRDSKAHDANHWLAVSNITGEAVNCRGSHDPDHEVVAFGPCPLPEIEVWLDMLPDRRVTEVAKNFPGE